MATSFKIAAIESLRKAKKAQRIIERREHEASEMAKKIKKEANTKSIKHTKTERKIC